uniref:Uncharacterized protein n=1 Tax=Arundo donax TaxID=35708 RepID=A0A0A8ZEJ7_ARUDO
MRPPITPDLNHLRPSLPHGLPKNQGPPAPGFWPS